MREEIKIGSRLAMEWIHVERQLERVIEPVGDYRASLLRGEASMQESYGHLSRLKVELEDLTDFVADVRNLYTEGVVL